MSGTRRIWLTARYEARTHLGRRSFWITTFVLPAALVLLVLLVQAFSGGTKNAAFLPGVESGATAIGYVDQAGLLHALPANLPPGLVRSFPDEQEARAALSKAEIDRYYLIPADYLASGRLTIVQARYQPLRAVTGSELITYALDVGLSSNENLARLLLDPTPQLNPTALAPVAGTGASGRLAGNGLLPYLLMFILYLALAMTSGFMLQSVSKEKENRTAEMLLVSLSPRHLMLGKIAGLSLVGLLQVAIWLAAFFGLLSGSGGFLGVDIHLSGQLAVHVIPWTIAYFLLGYLMYASVYATFGVLALTLRDANHFVYIAIIPLVVPLLFNSAISAAPNGRLATTLSLIPLTAPIAMVARLGTTSVPWWEALAGLVALALFAYGFALLAARLFRAENVLSSHALTWARLRAELQRRPDRALLAERAGAPPARPARSAAGQSTSELGRGRARQTSGGRPARAGAGSSKQRLYVSMLAGAVIVIVGVVEYTRGQNSGIIIAAVGVLAAFASYWRRRKS
jgi:ABC-2 type transport system permease protein